jgi:hypothetical protein
VLRSIRLAAPALGRRLRLLIGRSIVKRNSLPGPSAATVGCVTVIVPARQVEHKRSGAAPDCTRSRACQPLPAVSTCQEFILFSCPDDAGQRVEAIRLEAQDHLVRPLQKEQLEAVIRHHLMSRKHNGNSADLEIAIRTSSRAVMRRSLSRLVQPCASSARKQSCWRK